MLVTKRTGWLPELAFRAPVALLLQSRPSLSSSPSVRARVRVHVDAGVVGVGIALALLAVVSGPRLDDDSYRHFARSVQAVASLDGRGLITNLWNKPLTGLIYGVTGLLGLTAARLAAVALTMLTLHLTVELCQVLLPRAVRWPMLLLFVSQPALLRDAFVTMTEIPAACCLASSLWAQLCAGRARWAAFAIGLMPLCRVEMLPVTLFVTLWLAHAAAVRGLREQLVLLALAALPSLAWYAAAAVVAHDALWFRGQGYARVRAWDLAGCLRFNVFGGLAAVLSAPSLLLFWLGVLSARRMLTRSVAALVLGALACHYALLDVLDVFPRGVEGVPLGHAVAAINPRNYTSSAPLVAVCCGSGLAYRLEAGSVARRPLMAAALLSAAVIVNGDIAQPVALLRDSALLASSIAVLGFRAPARAWQAWALASVTAALIMRPGFGYPTRWNDRRAASIDALAQLARDRHPARLIQDLASSLEHYAGLQGVDADWIWPRDFATRMNDESVVVIEVDAEQHALARYPANLSACLTPRALVAAYDSPAQPSWLSLIDRVVARNAAVHWRAYRPPAHCP